MSRGTNGVAREIVRAIRGAHPGQIVAVLLAGSSADGEREMVESGASAVVGTPCSPGEFLTRLMTAMVRS
jgi:AmiR/NasT family two-component response regulator